MISECTCKSEYQDKQYGKGNRVFNRKTKRTGKIQGIARCTVCGYVLQSSSGFVERQEPDVV